MQKPDREEGRYTIAHVEGYALTHVRACALDLYAQTIRMHHLP